MSDSLNKKLTASVNAWHKLWSVGANGETIKNNKDNQSKKRKKDRNNKDKLQNRPSGKEGANTSKRKRNPNNNEFQQTTTTQINLHSKNIDLQDVEEFGDTMRKKNEKTLRIMFHNINRLTIRKNSAKSKKLISTIANKQIDVALLAEIGLNWKKIQSHDKWYERTREAFQTSKSSVAYNINEDDYSDQVQFSGVIIMAVEDEAKRVTQQETDLSGWGRWLWLRLSGRAGHNLRVVSAYRPVESLGPNTVFAQHQQHFFSKDRDDDPREAFYHDLKITIEQWKAKGDHIIIGLDANEDIRLGLT